MLGSRPGIYARCLIHTAHKVRNWFKEMSILVTDWPPYSPGLNLIKHAWRKLKELVLEKHIEISNIENIREALKKAI
jgi:transposase